MSAYGYKQTSSPYLANVRFTPESRHSNGETPKVTFGCPLCPQKQTLERVSLNVRF